MEVFENLKANLVGKNARIVLPEGEEPRILQATKRIVNETEVTPVLLGNPDKIRIYLEIEGVLDGYEVIDPHSYPGFEEELKGCNYIENKVEVDGNIITSRGPATAMEFAYKLLEVLGEESYKEIRTGMLYQ